MTSTPRTEAEWKRMEGQGLTIQHKWHAQQLEHELNAANERIRRLEEAGDNLTNCIACGCDDGGCRTCRETEDNWRKAKETKP